jgi:hypothetical protein
MESQVENDRLRAPLETAHEDEEYAKKYSVSGEGAS